MSTSPEVVAAARRFSRIINGAALTPAITLLSYITYVKWKLRKTTHRPFIPDDMYYIRTMDGSTPSIMDNPGIRIESNFLSEEEQNALRFESKVMLSLYGYSIIPFWTRPNWNKQISSLLSKTRVNAIKVTGRDSRSQIAEPPMTDHAKQLREDQEAALIKTKPYETNKPIAAPWKTGHTFNMDLLPKVYQDLIQKIKQLPGYKLGSIRDFSIDYRDDRYFKFDPHITPGLDGPSVFMLTLESDGVITLLPPEKDVYRRIDSDDIATYSYSDQDIDILHKRGDLLCLSDRAREKLDWSVRLGIDAKTNSLKQIIKRKYISKNIKQDEENNNNNNNTMDNYGGYMEEDDELYQAVIVGNEDIVHNIDQNQHEYVLCDWWGTSKQLIPRNKDKILITVTFGRPT